MNWKDNEEGKICLQPPGELIIPLLCKLVVGLIHCITHTPMAQECIIHCITHIFFNHFFFLLAVMYKFVCAFEF